MYIESLEVTNFRCFEHARVLFEYDGRHQESSAPRLPNVNLILGDNGTGKSAILRAIILAVLGPFIQSSGFRPYMLVRRVGDWEEQDRAKRGQEADVRVKVRLHAQDTASMPAIWDQETTGTTGGRAVISRRSSIETINAPSQGNSDKWEPLFDDLSPAFFLVAYGANRRVENVETFDSGARSKTRAVRYQRVAGIFEEAVTLTPVNIWWNEAQQKGRLGEAITLLNSLLPTGVQAANELLRVSGSVVTTDVLFNVRGTSLPFSALSDGYRGFVGWVVDLLYQMGQVAPKGHSLTELSGVVIVDELDLLLHPAWQRTVIETLATTFPRLQFFFTSHSPIVAGTLEAANIIVTEVDEGTGEVSIHKGREKVYGLSADQVLSSPYFGLASSRSQGAERRLRDLAQRAWDDDDAAEEYLRVLADGDDSTAANGTRETPTSKRRAQG